MSIKLPVYEIRPNPAEPEQAIRLAADFLGAQNPKLDQREGRVVATDGPLTVELFQASGGIHAADAEHLRVVGEPPKELPTAERAFALAEELIDKHGLRPELGSDDLELTRLDPAGTLVATETDGVANRFALDVQARYGLTVLNPGIEGEPDRLPLVGGGGKLTVTFGDGERRIGLHSSVRSVAKSTVVEALDRDEAGRHFAKLTDHLEVSDIRSTLAYYAAPIDAAQELLTPVWVFGGTLKVDGEPVPMRMVTIPATDFGPFLPESKPQRPRPKKSLTDRSASPSAAPRGANPFEAGTSWIGQLGGLGGSQQNAQGFVNQLSAEGWLVNFNWGDANAWESDWDANDDSYVDAADFVFYTGHASQNGWLLVTPGTSNFVTLTPSVVGASPEQPGDRWGQNDLEWVVVAACGPLQDEILSPGGGDVLHRWDGAFDGLHTLMGYGAITFDNTDEGRKVAQYSREGTPLIDAWFRTAQEVQPSTNGSPAPDGPTVWVGAMYVVKAGVDPRNDHLWGRGSVSADPTSPTTLVCMWSPC